MKKEKDQTKKTEKKKTKRASGASSGHTAAECERAHLAYRPKWLHLALFRHLTLPLQVVLLASSDLE
ncbi:hypothetical protein E2C01_049160 [Portunus trituberculatus]|uniref:Uncharacterized protein n=1 Tax=Portunus trituberculatus TaxID=210409 RepID=A0A5B7GDG8_PORTR|nr:hypothetical protein [Portunus trituberculatus]